MKRQNAKRKNGRNRRDNLAISTPRLFCGEKCLADLHASWKRPSDSRRYYAQAAPFRLAAVDGPERSNLEGPGGPQAGSVLPCVAVLPCVDVC